MTAPTLNRLKGGIVEFVFPDSCSPEAWSRIDLSDDEARGLCAALVAAGYGDDPENPDSSGGARASEPTIESLRVRYDEAQEAEGERYQGVICSSLYDARHAAGLKAVFEAGRNAHAEAIHEALVRALTERNDALARAEAAENSASTQYGLAGESEDELGAVNQELDAAVAVKDAAEDEEARLRCEVTRAIARENDEMIRADRAEAKRRAWKALAKHYRSCLHQRHADIAVLKGDVREAEAKAADLERQAAQLRVAFEEACGLVKAHADRADGWWAKTDAAVAQAEANKWNADRIERNLRSDLADYRVALRDTGIWPPLEEHDVTPDRIGPRLAELVAELEQARELFWRLVVRHEATDAAADGNATAGRSWRGRAQRAEFDVARLRGGLERISRVVVEEVVVGLREARDKRRADVFECVVIDCIEWAREALNGGETKEGTT